MALIDYPVSAGEIPLVRGFKCACITGIDSAAADPREAPETLSFRMALAALHELFVPPACLGEAPAWIIARHKVYRLLAVRARELAEYEYGRAAEILDRFNHRLTLLTQKLGFDAFACSKSASYWLKILHQCAQRSDAEPELINGLGLGARQLHHIMLLLEDKEKLARRAGRPDPALLARIQGEVRLVIVELKGTQAATPQKAAYQAIIVAHLFMRQGVPLPPGDPAAWVDSLSSDARREDFVQPLPALAELAAALPAALCDASGQSEMAGSIKAARRWFYKALRTRITDAEKAGVKAAPGALVERADTLHVVAQWLVERSRRLPVLLRAPRVQPFPEASGDDAAPAWEPADPNQTVAQDYDPYFQEVELLLDLALSKDQLWTVLMRHALLLRAGLPWPPLNDRSAVAELRATRPALDLFRSGYDPLLLYTYMGSAELRSHYPTLRALAGWIPKPTLKGDGEDVINKIINLRCQDLATAQVRERGLDDTARRELTDRLQYAARQMLGHEVDTPRQQRHSSNKKTRPNQPGRKAT